MLFLMMEAVTHAESTKQDASAKSQSDTFITQSQKGQRALNFRRHPNCLMRRIIMEQVREAIGTEEADGEEYPERV